MLQIRHYKAFLFQGHVLDENGGKMSKSKGNVLDGAELLKKYPADLIQISISCGKLVQSSH